MAENSVAQNLHFDLLRKKRRMNLRTVLLSPPLMMEPNIFVIFAILTSTLVSAHFDDVIQGKQKTRLKNLSVPQHSI